MRTLVVLLAWFCTSNLTSASNAVPPSEIGAVRAFRGCPAGHVVAFVHFFVHFDRGHPNSSRV